LIKQVLKIIAKSKMLILCLLLRLFHHHLSASVQTVMKDMQSALVLKSKQNLAAPFYPEKERHLFFRLLFTHLEFQGKQKWVSYSPKQTPTP
jgi:hypothetical protein